MSQWKTVCPLTDIAPNTGVCALHQGEQVALFPQISTTALDDIILVIEGPENIVTSLRADNGELNWKIKLGRRLITAAER